MISKMDFTAFKYEESDPVKFNREEVKSLSYAQHFSHPKIVKRINQKPETNLNTEKPKEKMQTEKMSNPEKSNQGKSIRKTSKM